MPGTDEAGKLGLSSWRHGFQLVVAWLHGVGSELRHFTPGEYVAEAAAGLMAVREEDNGLAFQWYTSCVPLPPTRPLLLFSITW